MRGRKREMHQEKRGGYMGLPSPNKRGTWQQKSKQETSSGKKMLQKVNNHQ